MTYPVTDRCDFYTADESEIALRLRGVPTFGVTLLGGVAAFDSRYYVMELQQGKLIKADDLAVDDDYDWKPYLLVVINTEDVDDISLLDATTGYDLAPPDTMQALVVLRAMHQEMCGMKLEDEVVETYARPTCDDTARRFGAFVSAEHVELSACDTCHTENTPCEHDIATLN